MKRCLLVLPLLGSDSAKEYDDRAEITGIEGTWQIVSGGVIGMVQCKRCGGELVQKSRRQLALVGALMLLALGLGLLWSPLWVPGVILGPTGAYLLVWASFGQGRWCRGCKRFDGV